MFTSVKSKISLIVADAAAVASPVSASANEIALTLTNEDISFVGLFAGFGDGAYVILVDGQEWRVPAVLATCKGEACLETVTASTGS